jgi:hypothetical protein
MAKMKYQQETPPPPPPSSTAPVIVYFEKVHKQDNYTQLTRPLPSTDSMLACILVKHFARE